MRYNYLDFARGILMSMGIILHTAYIFSTYKWRISSGEENVFFSYVIDFIHSFRMESFYIVSGFFSMMVVERYSIKKFLVTRLVRLGVPMLFCGLTLNIVMHILSGNNANNLSDAFSINFWYGGEWLAHLWFLANLIGYCLLLFVTFLIFNKYLEKLKWLRVNYFVFLLLAIGSIMISRRIGWRIPDAPFGDKWLLFDLDKFVYYFTYYLVGIALYLNRSLRFKYVRIYAFNALIVLPVFIARTFFGEAVNEYVSEILDAAYSIGFSGLVFAVFYTFFNKSSSMMRSVSDASYTIYLLHQPIIVIWGTLVVTFPMHYGIKFLLIAVPAWVIPYFFHVHIVSKSSVIGFLFNGKKIKGKP